MKIGSRLIARGGPGVYIIAEIGVNHDGSAERALGLVRAAAAAGADAVKFQFFQTDLLMSADAKLAAYQAASGEVDPISMLRRLELPLEALAACSRLAHQLNLHSIVTVFSVELVEAVEGLEGQGVAAGGKIGAGFDAYKTASPDLVHKPLLAALAATGKPMILSTGAAEREEVERALGWLGCARERVALLQCVSSYPTPMEHAALGVIGDLARLHSGAVGYSDHTRETATGALAVARGAVILEKHLTHDRGARGPDHAASLDPRGFAEYVRLARGAAREPREILSADQPIERKQATPIEREVRMLSRQSVVSRAALRAGETLRADMLTIKRPGTGIPAHDLEMAIGRRVARDIEEDRVLKWSDLETT